MEPRMVPNTVSAPRDREGFAVTADINKLQVFVNRSARLNWLEDKERTDTHEYRTLSAKIIRAKTDDPLLEAPLLSIKERMAELKNSSDKKERRDGKSGSRRPKKITQGRSTGSSAGPALITAKRSLRLTRYTLP